MLTGTQIQLLLLTWFFAVIALAAVAYFMPPDDVEKGD